MSHEGSVKAQVQISQNPQVGWRCWACTEARRDGYGEGPMGTQEFPMTPDPALPQLTRVSGYLCPSSPTQSTSLMGSGHLLSGHICGALVPTEPNPPFISNRGAQGGARGRGAAKRSV